MVTAEHHRPPKIRALMLMLLAIPAACQQSPESPQPRIDSGASAPTLVQQIRRGDTSVCADPAVLEMIGSEGIDQPFDGYLWTDDDAAAFWSNYSAAVHDITADGVESEASRVRCAGRYEASTPGWSNSARIEYDVQATVDGSFVVRTVNLQDLRDVAAGLKATYWNEKVAGPAERERQRRVAANTERARQQTLERERQDRLASEVLDQQSQADAQRRAVIDRVENVGPPPVVR